MMYFVTLISIIIHSINDTKDFSYAGEHKTQKSLRIDYVSIHI